MNKIFFNLFIHILFLFSLIKGKSNHKGQGKFERIFKECSTNASCGKRSNDADCSYKCVSKECYNEMIESKNVIIEFGEVNNDFRKKFEQCYYYKENSKKKK